MWRLPAGRITALRDMGNSQFLDLSDFDGRIQLFVNKKAIGEEQAGADQADDRAAIFHRLIALKDKRKAGRDQQHGNAKQRQPAE